MVKKYVDFKSTAYKVRMNELMKSVNKMYLDYMAMSYRVALANNEFNPLDVKYIGEMMASISTMTNEERLGVLTGKMGVGNRMTVNNYFRVIYYEYGTGEYARPPAGYSPSSDPYRNPDRPGDKFHYWKGNHKDMGGNVKRGTGKSHELPERINGKPNPYAMPIVPHNNMTKAALNSKPFLQGSLRRAVMQLNPISYISLRGIHVRA